MSENDMGTLRRIDELGRIVIPKGIRSRLNISEGDRLEIVVNSDKEIVVKKYNSFGTNYSYIEQITSLLAKEIERDIFIISSESVLTASNSKYEENYVNRSLDKGIYQKLADRKTILVTNERIIDDGEITSYHLYPMAYNGEVLGGIVILGQNPLTDTMIRVLSTYRNLITSLLKM